MDPANADSYKQNFSAYSKKLDSLDNWVKKELSKIPSKQRYIVTSHAAFMYFCEEYRFKAVPVQGINAEHDVSAKHLAETNKVISQKGIKAIFSEKGNNPKELKMIATATGAKLGGSLYADSAKSVEEMFKHNVTTIVKGLTGE